MKQFYTTLETKAGKEDDRTVEFIASKEVVDRDGEILKVSGITTTNYKKNPVVLWAHDRAGLPIGKAIKVSKRGDEMKIKVKFANADEYGFADTVYKLVKGGYLRAVSIGFLPDMTKVEYPEKNKKVYRIFHKSDLLEMSVVPVPANQDALSVGKALEDGVIDEVEKNEWDLFCKDIKLEEKEPYKTDDGALELTDDEKNERIDELEQRVVELEIEATEQKIAKSYLDSFFNKDASGDEPDEGQTDEELTEEDMQEIYDYFNKPEVEEE